jgi:hypothetical protein
VIKKIRITNQRSNSPRRLVTVSELSAFFKACGIPVDERAFSKFIVPKILTKIRRRIVAMTAPIMKIKIAARRPGRKLAVAVSDSFKACKTLPLASLTIKFHLL